VGLVQRHLGFEKAQVIFGDLRLRVVGAVGVLKYSNGTLIVEECSIEIAFGLKDGPDVVDISGDLRMIGAVGVFIDP
jgi:hypothetical protein